jgi:uncharacterized protein YyaL (SSP411 family)
MLYDNGPLLALCCDACLISDQTSDNTDQRNVHVDLFREASGATADWVMAEMQSAEGGYFSSLDADSEGEEGKFFVWTPDEIRAVLEAQPKSGLLPAN